MATFEVGKKVKVIKPCRTSGNRKGLVGFITEIDENSLDGFGKCTIHRVCRQKNCNHKNCRIGKDEGWYEHESGIRLYSPISEGRATKE